MVLGRDLELLKACVGGCVDCMNSVTRVAFGVFAKQRGVVQ
jgi:hypothetical protein